VHLVYINRLPVTNVYLLLHWSINNSQFYPNTGPFSVLELLHLASPLYMLHGSFPVMESIHLTRQTARG
jgi:hypothetical protein